MLSSSLIAVTVAPLARVRLVLAVIPPPSAIVIASSPSVKATLAVLISPVVEISPDAVIAPVLSSASVRERSPVLAPVNVPVATVTLSSLSSQPMKTLFDEPLSMTTPASPEGVPVVPLASSSSLSDTTVLVVETVVVSPVTVRSPLMATSPLVFRVSMTKSLLKKLDTEQLLRPCHANGYAMYRA